VVNAVRNKTEPFHRRGLRLAFGLSLLFASQMAFAAGPVSRIADTIRPFKSMDAAAVSALRLAASKSNTLEYGGCILTDGRLYYQTVPVTSGSAGEIVFDCEIPKSLKLAGIYHTHPLGTRVHGFSPNDVRVSKSLGKTSYVASLDLNIVVRFVPGITRLQCLDEGRSMICSNRFSQGDLIGPLLPDRR
jgi:hypothetical protein